MATAPMPSQGDFPANNNAAKAAQPIKKEEKPRVEKVIEGEAKIKKPSLLRRVGASFTGDDLHSVGDYVLLDVLVPAAKNMISDALTTTVERFFFGDGRRRPTSYSGGTSSYGRYESYNRYSEQQPPWRTEPRREPGRRPRPNHDFREVILPDRMAAGLVLDSLTELCSRYGVVTVQDFYDACGLSTDYTENKWGWTDIRNASVARVSGGYIIDIEPPRPLS